MGIVGIAYKTLQCRYFSDKCFEYLSIKSNLAPRGASEKLIYHEAIEIAWISVRARASEPY